MDPYKVLGVSPHATDEEVKAAYRDLARKYHPDNYQNNPLADLASEKMTEINQAYDQIMEMRRNGKHAGSGGSYRQSSAGSFADVRAMINTGRIAEAEEILRGTPQNRRDAEWYFLMGTIYYTRGWLDEAYRHFTTAVQMNPQNPEYAAALNRMAWQRGGGMNRPAGYPAAGGCTACDACSGLICADCCCECMGGDLIRCC